MLRMSNRNQYSSEIVGELIDVTEGKQALSMLHTTPDMEDRFGYIDPQYCMLKQIPWPS